MRFTVLLAFAALFLALGCNKKVSPEVAPATTPANEGGVMKMVAFGEIISLAPGETAKVEKTKVTVGFVSVASDSRCPRGTNCITEGEAFVMVSVGGGAPQRVRIDVDPKRTSRLSMEGATVEFLGLNPYPTGVRIAPAERRLRVRMVKSAKM